MEESTDVREPVLDFSWGGAATAFERFDDIVFRRVLGPAGVDAGSPRPSVAMRRYRVL